MESHPSSEAKTKIASGEGWGTLLFCEGKRGQPELNYFLRDPQRAETSSQFFCSEK
jgi:hypothetical protein